MILTEILPALAFFWITLFPPQSIQAISWIGPVILVLACFSFLDRPSLSRGAGALGFSLIVGCFLCFLSHGWAAVSALPMAILLLICFSLGQRSGEKPSRNHLSYLFAALVLIEAILAFTQRWMSIADFQTGSAIAERLAQHRVWGSFITSNTLSAWLLIALPILLAENLATSQRSIKYVSGFGVALGLPLLACTASGGANLAFLLTVILFFYFLSNRIPKDKKLAWMGLGLFTIFCLAASLWQRGFTIFQSGSGQDLFYGRTQLWIPGWIAFLKAPFFGWGPALAEGAYRQAQIDSGYGFGAFPHQVILSLGINYGLCGILVALIWLTLYGARLRRLLQNDGSARRVGAAFAVMSALIHAQWEMSFQQPAILLLFAFVAGLALSEVPPMTALAPEETQMYLQSDIYLEFWPVLIGLALLLAIRGGLMSWQWPLCAGVVFFLWLIKRDAKIPKWNDPGSIVLLLLSFLILAALVNGGVPGDGVSEFVALASGFFCFSLLRR